MLDDKIKLFVSEKTAFGEIGKFVQIDGDIDEFKLESQLKAGDYTIQYKYPTQGYKHMLAMPGSTYESKVMSHVKLKLDLSNNDYLASMYFNYGWDYKDCHRPAYFLAHLAKNGYLVRFDVFVKGLNGRIRKVVFYGLPKHHLYNVDDFLVVALSEKHAKMLYHKHFDAIGLTASKIPHDYQLTLTYSEYHLGIGKIKGGEDYPKYGYIRKHYSAVLVSGLVQKWRMLPTGVLKHFVRAELFTNNGDYVYTIE